MASRIADSSGNPRQRWKTIKQLLHPATVISASDSDSRSRCVKIAEFFIKKVVKIQERIAASLVGIIYDPLADDIPYVGTILDELGVVTCDEVTKILHSMPSKSSPRDFVPTSIVKSCADVFAPLIATLANLSFSEGRFPDMFKVAQVTPLLKKVGLSEDDPANFRPISNLNTISKVLEKLFLARISPHVQRSTNYNPLQSAYRKNHSTETAILKLVSDAYDSIDEMKPVILVALDISAAFDTIDHNTLLRRLKNTFGLTGIALEWIKSYLADRSSFVKLGEAISPTTPSSTGVPQGSVLGPLLFTLFISPVAEVVSNRGVSQHQYADDTQLYVAVTLSNVRAALDVLEECSTAVQSWFTKNGLALNPDKSEVIKLGTSFQLNSLADVTSVNIAGTSITPKDHIKSLGVTLDKRLSFDEHVNNICRTAFYHIRGFRHIRKVLNQEVAKTIACSIVGSRLDYCNACFYGMTEKNISKLQRVQNSLARVVTGVRKYEHITPTLADLHWLPVSQRINYKVATLIFKIKHSGEPKYLASMIRPYVQTRTLRSSSRNLLDAPKPPRTVIGERSFSSVAPTVWNNLPENIKSQNNLQTFQSQLKTHLYNIAYNR